MVAGTYAIVISGSGVVSEHILGTEEEGTTLPAEPSSITVAEMRIESGRRVSFLVVPLRNVSKTGVDFERLRTTGSLPIITALGSGKDFAYHKSKSNHLINLFVMETNTSVTASSLSPSTCLCPGDSKQIPFGKGTGNLVYTPVPGEPGSAGSKIPGSPLTQLHFSKDCQAYPASTMLLGKNPSCDVRTYTGGQSCCHHLFTLLDKNQSTPWQNQPLIYHHKWRIYYASDSVEDMIKAATPITNLVQFNYGGMASPTEYDVPKCSENVYGCSRDEASGDWIHEHNGTFKVSNMHNRGGPPPPQNAIGHQYMVVHGHCHAPTCIVFELWNLDNNSLICRQQGVYGQSNGTFNESGYLHIPPCVWGSVEEGLQPPLRLPFNTTLFGKKKCKANRGHHGEMSLWQTYGTYY
jgi:hypothetical protein